MARARMDVSHMLQDVQQLSNEGFAATHSMSGARVGVTGTAVFSQHDRHWKAVIQVGYGSSHCRTVKWDGPLPVSGKAACLKGVTVDAWYLPEEDAQVVSDLRHLLQLPIYSTQTNPVGQSLHGASHGQLHSHVLHD